MKAQRRDLLKLSPLALAAFAPAAMFAETAGRRRELLFDVRTFGAAGDGKTLDTAAVNAAIEAAAAAGGGTVFFAAGTYVCFSIHLKSHVALYLDMGAVVLAADSPAPGETTGYRGGTYDAAGSNAPWEAYQDYLHNHWRSSLLWGEGLENVMIYGPGMIWGKGLSRGGYGWFPPVDFQAEQAGVGTKSLALKNCRNVILKDFSILQGGAFGMLLTGCDNVTIDNLKVDANRDGMDIDCCRNVHISRCTVNSPWDDGICLKSSYALGEARATEKVTISDCIVTGYYKLGTTLDGTFQKFGYDEYKLAKGDLVSRAGRIKMGTESNGGFKNISISNCVFEGCAGVAIESEDGGMAEDIAITNIAMRDLVSGPLFFRLGARLRGPKETTKVGSIKRIMVSNIVSSNARSSFCNILSGLPGHPIEDVKIANFYSHTEGGGTVAQAGVTPPEKPETYPDPKMFGVLPAQGFFLRHVRNLEMSHVEIVPAKADARPSFYLEDVERVDFMAVTAAAPAFALHGVKDLRISVSRAAKDVVVESAEVRVL